MPQISCSQPGVTVSVSLGSPTSRTSTSSFKASSGGRGHGRPPFDERRGAALRPPAQRRPARAYGQANPGPSTLVTITFVKQRREIAWPEPLAVVIPHDGASHPRTADEMLAEAMAPAPAPAPAAPAASRPRQGHRRAPAVDLGRRRRRGPAAAGAGAGPPRTPGAPAPAPTLVTPAAPAPAPADDDDGVEMVVMTPEMLKKRRFDEAIANGEVIEIPSDDDEAPQVARTPRRKRGSTRPRSSGARSKKGSARGAAESAFTEARAAQYIRDHRFFPVSTLTAKCRAAGLKVSGKRTSSSRGSRCGTVADLRRPADAAPPRPRRAARGRPGPDSAHPAPGDEGELSDAGPVRCGWRLLSAITASVLGPPPDRPATRAARRPRLTSPPPSLR